MPMYCIVLLNCNYYFSQLLLIAASNVYTTYTYQKIILLYIAVYKTKLTWKFILYICVRPNFMKVKIFSLETINNFTVFLKKSKKKNV